MQESTQPERVETPAVEIPREKATMAIGEISTLPGEEATAETGETSTLRDSPKNSTSLGLQLGKEVLMS